MRSLFVLCLCCISSLWCAQSVITYSALEGSRFGDQLLCYLHAKWISYEYSIPIRYKKFRDSDRLVLHDKEIRFQEDREHKQRVEVIWDLKQRQDICDRAVTYVCPYFSEDEVGKNSSHYFAVNWKDPKFRKIALAMIAPKTKPSHLIVPPQDAINIALHLREGGTRDSEGVKRSFPLKFPPMDFYIEGLNKVVSLFPSKKIFCYVFSDAQDVEKIVAVLKKNLPQDCCVQFSHRVPRDKPQRRLIDDFFSFFNFDILIRPDSNFSLVPSLLHDFAIVYAPSHSQMEGDSLVINEVSMEFNEPLFQKLFVKEEKRSFWTKFFR